MRVHKGHFERLRRAVAAGVVALIAAAPVLAADAAHPAASRYVPTMADYLGVYDALQHYRFGVEKHDQKMDESAFWDDAANIAVPSPGQEIRMPVRGGGSPQPLSGPPGASGGPPPGFGPPPGANAGPPGPKVAHAGPPPGLADRRSRRQGGGDVWHLPLDSYIHFESATRATHYEYFLSIYPQPEKKARGRRHGEHARQQNFDRRVAGPLRRHPGEAPWRVADPAAQVHDQPKVKDLATHDDPTTFFDASKRAGCHC